MSENRTMLVLSLLSLVAAGCAESPSPLSPTEETAVQVTTAEASSQLSETLILIGESVTLTTSLSSAKIIGRSRTQNVTWTSRNTSVAQVVASTGLATGVGVGTTWLVSSNGTGRDSVQVTVASAERLAISPASLSIPLGTGIQLTANTTLPLQWSTSDSTVASVSSTGYVRAIRSGVALIAAYSSRIGRSTSSVTVVGDLQPPPPPPTGLLSSPSADLPLRTVSFSYPAVTGRTLRVRAGQSVQRAIDTSRAGDEIVLARGATFTENIVLRRKTMNGGWIHIRGDSISVSPGSRVSPSTLAGAAKVVGAVNGISAVQTEPGASGYWLSGFEVTLAPSVSVMYALVALDADVTSQSLIPTRLVLDRMYIHGTTTVDLFRCVLVGSSNIQISESYISECHARGFDSQAILLVTTEGPVLIRNNLLEGAGENIMLGGAVPTVSGVIPSDIEIVRNHLRKPMAWLGGPWSIKNLFEIKIGQRIDVRENYLENNWVASQNGFGVLIRAANQEEGSWLRTNNVTFRHNVLNNSASGLNIIADGSVKLNRVAILGNLLDGIGSNSLGGGFRLVQFSGALSSIDMSYNTLLFAAQSSSEGVSLMLDGNGAQGFGVNSNIIDGGLYGVFASGQSPGVPSLNAYAGSSYSFAGNVMSVETGRSYPSGNLLLSQSQASFGFSSWLGRDYRPTSASPLLSRPTAGASQAGLAAAFGARSF